MRARAFILPKAGPAEAIASAVDQLPGTTSAARRPHMPRPGTTGCDVRCGVATAALDQATPEVAVAVVRLRDAAAGWLRGEGGDGGQNGSYGEPLVEVGTVG